MGHVKSSLLDHLAVIRKRCRSVGHWAQTHKRIVLPVAFVLALSLVAGTYAWLTSTSVLDNLFDFRAVQPEIVETLSGDTKSDVKVRNDGKEPSYIRCQVEVYWRDAEGNRLWQTPVSGTDYSLTMATSASTSPTPANSWVQGADGFWYWTSPLAAGASTSTALITEAKQLKAAEGDVEGAQLVVDITTQAIQAEDSSASSASSSASASSGGSGSSASSATTRPVENAWGATVDSDGTLTPKAQAGS